MRGACLLLLGGLLLAAAGCGRSSIPSASDAARAEGGGPTRSAAPSAGASAPAGSSTPSDRPRFSYLNTGDIRARAQLISGWYAIEDGSFRWIGREARAVLQVPQESTLSFQLRLFFPENHMQRAGGPVSVSVFIEDTLFAQETYAQSGPYTLYRPVPAGLLSGASANLTLRVDRAVPPAGKDKRELGVVVQGFGFVPEQTG